MDRNYKERPGQKARPKSLSARRAWIEIACQKKIGRLLVVALRKESVDRNPLNNLTNGGPVMSLSARRAWIEIIGLTYDGLIASVALRKESVDRNNVLQCNTVIDGVALRKESVDRNQSLTTQYCLEGCRSPQGERG